MGRAPAALALALAALVAATGTPAAGAPGVGARLEWHSQLIDHFGERCGPGATFRQRVFVNDEHFVAADGVVLFYTGNEADVTLYVNHTGLMWENARDLRALLVFAEHRYYGESQVVCAGSDANADLRFLTHEQALADYVAVIADVRERYGAEEVAVVALGGSYGGMLSAWMRMRYPAVVDGAIAASAPILAFPHLAPTFDTESYWRVVTAAARPSPGGAADACAANVRAAWAPLFAHGESAAGREVLQRAFGLCEPPSALGGQGAGERVAYFAMMAFDTLAMGNFPFSSDCVCAPPAHGARGAYRR